MSKLCSNCNAENIDEAKFCRKCGSTISKIVKDDIIKEEAPLIKVEKIESEWDKKYAKLQQEVRDDRKKVKEKEDIKNTHTSNDEEEIKKTYTKLDVFFYPNNYTEEEKKKILGDEYE